MPRFAVVVAPLALMSACLASPPPLPGIDAGTAIDAGITGGCHTNADCRTGHVCTPLAGCSLPSCAGAPHARSCDPSIGCDGQPCLADGTCTYPNLVCVSARCLLRPNELCEADNAQACSSGRCSAPIGWMSPCYCLP